MLASVFRKRTRMKQNGVIAVCMAVILGIYGCETIRVSQDYDSRFTFPHQGTWQWRDQTQPATGDIRIDNPLLDKRIRKAVETGLKTRNFHRLEEFPTFLLAYDFSIEAKIEADTYYSNTGIWGYRYPWFGGMGRDVRINQYNEGRLTIDILFSETGALLWRGTGIYRFNTDKKTPPEIDAEIHNLVNTILMPFPPENRPSE